MIQKQKQNKNEKWIYSIIVAVFAYSIGYFHGSQSEVDQSYADSRTLGHLTASPQKKNGLIQPLEHTEMVSFFPGHSTDSYNYFHNYFYSFARQNPNSPKDFLKLPMFHSWPIYYEAYYNHMYRYRGKKVIFMEIGVQSGGKIPMLRDFFGPGLTYIGVDINPSVKKFESADWINIEIGDAGDAEFLEKLKVKYPKVDILLDDGSHRMIHQKSTIKEMLPHVQPNGIYICEDLSTSWNPHWGGIRDQDHRNEEFRNTTMVGLVHRTIDWLWAGWIPGSVMHQKDMPTAFWQDEPWWQEFQKTVKHIHIYNQIVVYEKGHVDTPFNAKTVGESIPYRNSGVHTKVDWEPVLSRVSEYTMSQWNI